MANPSKRYPWQVEMLSPTGSALWFCVAAYRARDEAEASLRLWQQRAPQESYRISLFGTRTIDEVLADPSFGF